MEGRAASSTSLTLRARETVLISHADSARFIVPPLRATIERQGLDCRIDEKLRDPGADMDSAHRARIDASRMLCFALTRRCRQMAWQDAEAAYALARGIPVIVFVEDRAVGWTGSTVPTLVTHDVARVTAFVAQSWPDSVSLWEFGKRFFVDRATAAQFRRGGNDAWRWEREIPGGRVGELSLEMSIVDDAAPTKPEACLVQATMENRMPVLLLGTTDWKRYRFAYSADVRAVLPAPVYPGAPVIGFMHADFETAREWPRAGEAPVELRLLGREVYGWHMSEYFWRAFVGSLPKMLGQTAER